MDRIETEALLLSKGGRRGGGKRAKYAEEYIRGLAILNNNKGRNVLKPQC